VQAPEVGHLAIPQLAALICQIQDAPRSLGFTDGLAETVGRTTSGLASESKTRRQNAGATGRRNVLQKDYCTPKG
jgi:hypothetical protein